MARPAKLGRSARVEFRSKPAHKALWEQLCDQDDAENFTEWMNDAANERAARILERREPGSSLSKGFPIRRPSAGEIGFLGAGRSHPASQPTSPKPKPKRRRKR